MRQVLPGDLADRNGQSTAPRPVWGSVQWVPQMGIALNPIPDAVLYFGLHRKHAHSRCPLVCMQEHCMRAIYKLVKHRTGLC
jgi:hypothetical protein